VQVSVIICLFTKIVGYICQVTHGRRTVLYFEYVLPGTNPHYTVDKNGVYLKITTFSCLNYYISPLFLLKIDHVMQINSKINKEFLCLASQLMLCKRTCPLM